MGKIRVLCFLEKWESGGIESFLNSLFENIDLESFEIDVVATDIGKSVFTERLTSLGIGFYELSGHPRSPKNRKLFRKLLSERHYDVLHLNIFHALAFSYAKDAKKMGVGVRIAHAHGAGLRKSFTRWIKLLIHRLGRRLYSKYLTARLACSSVAAEFVFGESADEIVKNGISLNRFLYSEEDRISVREELKASHAPIVGAVGRLAWEKNQALVIRAFPSVLEAFPNAKLLLIGEGPDEAALRALADELSVSDSVIFYGTSDNVPALLSAMDVFVLPSIFEGLGIVAIEAQCSGLPTLVSEAVPHEARVTQLAEVFPLSPDVLAEKIKSSLANPLPRRSYAEELSLAGYSDKDKAEVLTKYYTAGV